MIGIALGVALLALLAYLLIEGQIQKREQASRARFRFPASIPAGGVLTASELNAIQTERLEDGWDWPAAPTVGLELYDQLTLDPQPPLEDLEVVSTPRGYVLQRRCLPTSPDPALVAEWEMR